MLYIVELLSSWFLSLFGKVKSETVRGYRRVQRI